MSHSRSQKRVEKAPARKGPHTFEDIHKALFPDGPPEPKTLEELNEKHAL